MNEPKSQPHRSGRSMERAQAGSCLGKTLWGSRHAGREGFFPCEVVGSPQLDWRDEPEGEARRTYWICGRNKVACVRLPVETSGVFTEENLRIVQLGAEGGA